MAQQHEAFPLNVVQYLPFDPPFCRYANGRAVIENGDIYIIKGWGSPPEICGKEWFFSSLAGSLLLPVPEYQALRMSDGSLVFGSKQVDGVLSALEKSRLLFGASDNTLLAPELARDFSRLFAFDMLTGNYDRHIDNYLIAANTGPEVKQRIAKLFAIDFDATDIAEEMLGLDGLPQNCHTRKNAASLAERHGFDRNAANELITLFSTGASAFAERSFIGMPAGWLSEGDREKIRRRMQSRELQARITAIQEGIDRGSFV